MDIDAEINQRINDHEDHFTERKTSYKRDEIRRTIVAFANSVTTLKPGIIFIGITPKGEQVGIDNPDSVQQLVSEIASKCYPPIPIIPRVIPLTDNKGILVIIVPASPLCPHFALGAFQRIGSQTKDARQEDIDKWLESRITKVKYILDWKDKQVTVTGLLLPDQKAMRWANPAVCKIIDCNPFFVTFLELVKRGTNVTHTEPLDFVELKMDDKIGHLTLLIRQYTFPTLKNY